MLTFLLSPVVNCQSKYKETNTSKEIDIKMPQRKRSRGSRGAKTNVVNGNSSGGACDLMVVLPAQGSSEIKIQLQIKEIIDRLSSTGYSHMALVHTIYGRPRTTEDCAEVAIPASLWTSSSSPGNNDEPTIKVLRRLHVILENLSDVDLYALQGPHEALINEYDIVSVSPRNETVFQAACASATVADIISLDYTIRGLRLPYRIRPIDSRRLIERRVAIEIPIAPALIHPKQRKALVQTSRELQKSCLGLKPNILVSSGDRTFEDSDVGKMAFRMPGDISNLIQTVLQFDAVASKNAVGAAGFAVLKRAQDRRWGESEVSQVFFHEKGEELLSSSSRTKEHGDKSETKRRKQNTNDEKDSGSEVDAIEEGFISMS
jgi:RNase P/RNase MRP subunit p30